MEDVHIELSLHIKFLQTELPINKASKAVNTNEQA